MAFEKIREIRETKRAVYIYMTENDAWILPKAQMEDPAAEAAKLREIFGMVIESQRLHLRKG